MKFNFSKIASALASTVMVGSTVALAAAATFPAPFVDNGAADVALVYGNNLDLGAAADITGSLSSSLAQQAPSTGTPSGGDFVQLDKTSDRLNLGNAINGPFGGTVDDDDLPTLLADGTYTADDNDDFDYEQKITLGAFNLTHFRDSDYEKLAGLTEKTPVVAFKIGSGNLILNYSLDFTTDAESDIVSGDLDDIEGSDLPLFGKTFFVSDLKNGTDTTGSGGIFGKLVLLDSANQGTVEEGETTTLVVEGVSYDISIGFIDNDEVKFSVGIDGVGSENAPNSGKLQVGETYRLSNNAYIGVRDISKLEVSGALGQSTFSIGSGKLELTSGSDIKINDETINGVKGHVIRGTASSGAEKIDKITIEWINDDEEFVAPDSNLNMPGFGGLKFSMNDFKRPGEEKITVQHDSDTSIEVTVPIKDGDAKFNLLYHNGTTASNGGNFTGIGKDNDERLATSANSSLVFFEKRSGEDYDSWFVATYNTTTSSESYLLRPVITSTTTRVEADILNVVTGLNVCSDKTNGTTCSIGDVELTINHVQKNASDEWITIAAGTNVHFNTIFTKGGAKFYLPVNVGGTEGKNNHYGHMYNSRSGMAHTAVGSINLTDGSLAAVGFNPDRWYFYWDEEDKDDNRASGQVSNNVTLDANADKEVQVSQVDLSGTGGPDGLEVGNSNTYEGYLLSDVGTRWLHYTGGDQDYVELYYPADESTGDSESYAEVFLSSSSTTSGSGELGNIRLMASELSDSGMQTKNLISLGGSCVNTLSSQLLGGSAGCGLTWTAATGAGSGEWVIETFANPFSGTKVATLVGGWEQGDTANAATYLKTQTDILTDVGHKLKGTNAATASVINA
jgi:hypothetical protein